MTIWGVAMRRSKMRSYTALVDWKVPRLSSRSASIDHTFSDLYTRFCTGSEPSKYSARRAGSAVAFRSSRKAWS